MYLFIMDYDNILLPFKKFLNIIQYRFEWSKKSWRLDQ